MDQEAPKFDPSKHAKDFMKTLPQIEEPGYTLYVDGKFIRTKSLESLYKMLERIELQLSTRQDKVIRRLLDETREVLKQAELKMAE